MPRGWIVDSLFVSDVKHVQAAALHFTYFSLKLDVCILYIQALCGTSCRLCCNWQICAKMLHQKSFAALSLVVWLWSVSSVILVQSHHHVSFLQAIADGIYYYQGVVKLESVESPAEPVFAQPQAADFAHSNLFYVNIGTVVICSISSLCLGL